MDKKNPVKNKKSKFWIWKFYFLIYVYICVLQAGIFFSPESPMHLFYQILMAFNTILIIPYFLNAMSVLINLTSILPFFAFIYRKNFLTPRFCKYLFGFRLIFDIFGRTYEKLVITASSYHDSVTTFQTLALFIVLILPSYVANYKYAFKRDNAQA